MDTPIVVIVLRLIHVLAGVFWVGSIIFLARFVFPSAQALGPAAGPMLDHLTRVRRMPQALLGTAIGAVLSGLLLYWHDSAGFQNAWIHTGTSRVFGMGGGLAILGLLVGATVNSPTAKRLGALQESIRSAGGPPSAAQTAEMARLQGRLGVALKVVVVLLVLATAAMAVARYVG